jgi:hypothetical protein
MIDRRIFKATSPALLAGALLLASCSGASSGSAGSGGSNGSGGNNSSGGSNGSGGNNSSGGSNGSGGSTSSGGSKGSGGSTTTGGTTGSGGSTSSGGTTGSGGSTSSGGTTGSGGSTTSGGTTGSGGSTASGGATGTGGATSSGGATGTGGAAGSATTGGGGAAATGGAGGQVACPALPTTAVATSSIIQFNDNGGWCWYQDERAVVDTKANKLIIGSTASGGTRNGQNETVIYDLASNTPTRYTLPSSLSTSNVDDHNSPALLIRPDGKYMAQWAGHRVDCLSRFSIFDGTKWGAEYDVDWTSLGCPWAGASTNMITYANPWYIGSNIFSMVRSVDTDPGVLTSTDNGATFSYEGKLSSSPQVGYVAGYYKYWGNNTDRVDFLGTEAHPRDFDNSLYHGYVSGGKVYDSLGNVLDTSLKDTSSTSTNAADITKYTTVFKTGSTVNGVTLCRMWNYDIVRYADGTVGVLGQGRTNECTSTPANSNPDKRAIYARFDGSKWSATYLVKMGPSLYAAEEDYTGLAALDPDNPHVIYISTVYDPRDDTTMTAHHEIYEGITCDNGATWKWAPITQNSTVDQLRPIVPKWDSSHLALLWLQGTYTSAQQYSLKIVGLVKTSNP